MAVAVDASHASHVSLVQLLCNINTCRAFVRLTYRGSFLWKQEHNRQSVVHKMKMNICKGGAKWKRYMR
ncbi:hypothetical protein JOC93_001060 [Priestia taiwanensis]|nr:hypothetical protein [Priestia taiwanensis]